MRQGKDGKFVKNSIDSDFFLTISHKLAWLIGLFAADGNIHSTSKQISISQSGKNGKKLINYLSDLIKYGGTISNGIPKVGNIYYRIGFSSQAVVDVFNNFNIVGKKSLIYEFPDALDKNFYSSFIRGYIDGDGTVGEYDNGKGIKYLIICFVGTERFIKKCNKICPVPGNIYKKSGRNCWELRWNGKNAVKIGEWIYSNVDLYSGYKCKAYQKYKINCNTRWLEYDALRKNVFDRLRSGIKVIDIANEFDLPFQTIYKWKNKYGIKCN